MGLMVETPGIQPEEKVAAIETICSKVSADAATVNFLKVLVENKRMHLLAKMIDLFEGFYRAEKGLVSCHVTSAKQLTAEQKSQVKAAMEKRAEKGSTLILEYHVNSGIV